MAGLVLIWISETVCLFLSTTLIIRLPLYWILSRKGPLYTYNSTRGQTRAVWGCKHWTEEGSCQGSVIKKISNKMKKVMELGGNVWRQRHTVTSTVWNMESSVPNRLSGSMCSKECQENSGYGFCPGETRDFKIKQEMRKKLILNKMRVL